MWGGVVEMIRKGFEVMVEDGYEKEMEYLEWMKEMKMIVEMI